MIAMDEDGPVKPAGGAAFDLPTLGAYDPPSNWERAET